MVPHPAISNCWLLRICAERLELFTIDEEMNHCVIAATAVTDLAFDESERRQVCSEIIVTHEYLRSAVVRINSHGV